jgi:hypothetical protein
MRGARLVALVGGIVVMISLAGCTGSSAPRPSATKAPAAHVALPAPIPNNPKLHRDVAMNACSATKGGWSAGGHIVNTSSKGRDYKITVLFTSSKATAIGVGKTTVHVGADAGRDWRIQAKFAATSPTLCVLSGVA